MADVQDIVYSVTGQLLFLDVPEGRASSVTSLSIFGWNVGDDGTSEDAAGTPTVESDPDTTFDALSSGSTATNMKLLNLTATTGITIGRQYLVTDAAGRKEWVEIEAVTDGASATSRVGMLNTYNTGDTLESTRIVATIDPTWVADDTNISDGYDPNPGWRARWVYVVGGVTYVRNTYFDLVRVSGDHNVRPADVEMLLPGFVSLLPREHRPDRGRGLIDEAYKQLGIDLLREGIPDQQVRNQDIIDELVKRRVIMQWADWRAMTSGGDPAAAELARLRYESRFTQLIKAPSRAKVAIGVDTSGAGSVRAATRLTQR